MNKDKIGVVSIEWLLFVIVMVVLFFSTQTYFGTANYPRIYKINTFCIVSFLLLSVISNHGKIKCRCGDLFSYRVVLLPNVLLFIVSLGYYYAYRKVTFSNVIYYNMQPILLCMMAIVAFNLFGNKALKGIIVAAAINYMVYVITCIAKYGPFSLFQAGSDTKASRLLEVHEITFVFGLLVIYLVISNFFQKNKTKKRWLLLLAVFCLLGFKRILIVAMLLAVLLYKLIKKKEKPTAIIIISIIGIGVSLLWVYVCSSREIMTGIEIVSGIDLKGREWIYSNFYPYYELSVSYLGAGVGYVQQLIGEMSTMIQKDHSIGLHNDYMRLYIELGCIPYVFYFIIILPFISNRIYKQKGIVASVNYFTLWIVTLLCIATDNLLTYPNYMLTFFVLILTCINSKE